MQRQTIELVDFTADLNPNEDGFVLSVWEPNVKMCDENFKDHCRFSCRSGWDQQSIDQSYRKISNSCLHGWAKFSISLLVSNAKHARELQKAIQSIETFRRYFRERDVVCEAATSRQSQLIKPRVPPVGNARKSASTNRLHWMHVILIFQTVYFVWLFLISRGFFN